MAVRLLRKHLRTGVDAGGRMQAMPSRDLIYGEFGMLLARERKRKRLTQAEFASLASLSRTSITNIECGRQSIQIHQLYTFASILHIPVNDLLPKESMFVPPSPVETAKDEKATSYIAGATRALDATPRTRTEAKRGRQNQHQS